MSQPDSTTTLRTRALSTLYVAQQQRQWQKQAAAQQQSVAHDALAMRAQHESDMADCALAAETHAHAEIRARALQHALVAHKEHRSARWRSSWSCCALTAPTRHGSVLYQNRATRIIIMATAIPASSAPPCLLPQLLSSTMRGGRRQRCTEAAAP
eukprot:6211947-Pleurochrysis_carterae.AAC.9